MEFRKNRPFPLRLLPLLLLSSPFASVRPFFCLRETGITICCRAHLKIGHFRLSRNCESWSLEELYETSSTFSCPVRLFPTGNSHDTCIQLSAGAANKSPDRFSKPFENFPLRGTYNLTTLLRFIPDVTLSSLIVSGGACAGSMEVTAIPLSIVAAAEMEVDVAGAWVIVIGVFSWTDWRLTMLASSINSTGPSSMRDRACDELSVRAELNLGITSTAISEAATRLGLRLDFLPRCWRSEFSFRPNCLRKLSALARRLAPAFAARTRSVGSWKQKSCICFWMKYHFLFIKVYFAKKKLNLWSRH